MFELLVGFRSLFKDQIKPIDPLLIEWPSEELLH